MMYEKWQPVDPAKDAELSLADFNEAEKLMPDNAGNSFIKDERMGGHFES